MVISTGKNIKSPILGRRFKYNSNFINHNMSRISLAAQSRIKEKIDNGDYKYEKVACLCGNEDSLFLADMDGYGNYYPFVICKRCGIMRANPRLTEESYMDFYTYDYRALSGDDDTDREELYKSRIKQARDVYSFISRYVHLQPGAVVFDIGCNMGTMLLPFYEIGCEVIGVDYGVDYIEYGRKKTGLMLEIGGIEKIIE